MKAITLWRPWSDGVAYAGKDIENRGWVPWKSVIGTHIGIHAGRRFERLDLLEMLPLGFVPPQIADDSPQGIVAVAQVRGWIRRARGGHIEHGGNLTQVEADAAARSPWWSREQVGWVLDDVVAIPPVPAKGSQGLWTVPLDVVRRVRFRYRAAAAGLADARPRYLRVAARAAELRALNEDELFERGMRAGFRIGVTAAGLAGVEVSREMAEEQSRLIEAERAA